MSHLLRFFFIILITLTLGACSAHKAARKSHSSKHESAFVLNTKGLDHTRKAIVEEAMTWLGTPYKYAGEEKGSGADCSGMVMRVYEDAAGWKLPRNSAKQADFCDKLKPSKVAPGDLAFFATGKDPERVSHVGIMLDDTHFIHASSSKGVVISDISTPYYQRTFMMFGRMPRK